VLGFRLTNASIRVCICGGIRDITCCATCVPRNSCGTQQVMCVCAYPSLPATSDDAPFALRIRTQRQKRGTRSRKRRCAVFHKRVHCPNFGCKFVLGFRFTNASIRVFIRELCGIPRDTTQFIWHMTGYVCVFVHVHPYRPRLMMHPLLSAFPFKKICQLRGSQ